MSYQTEVLDKKNSFLLMVLTLIVIYISIVLLIGKNNQDIMAVGREEHLENVLQTHRMKHIDDLVKKYKTKRDEIKEGLEEYYNSNIYNPINSGSFAKHTAINTKFDLDIVVPFKRDSFNTIEEMFNDVYDFLKDKYQGEATVRKQKVSIGVIFDSDDDGDVISIDVVPGRETKLDDYPESKDLNIYFNENAWGFSKGTYTKTNIQAQIDHIKNRENERKVIRLLKIWKNENRENYKSFLLELFTIKAFEKTNISGNLWEKLKAVMTYIKDNVVKEDFTLIDPGNSNNDVMTSLDSWAKSSLASRMETIINRIEDNSENIKTYFPINEEFNSSDDSKSNSYGLKGASIIPSIPSNNQRFG